MSQELEQEVRGWIFEREPQRPQGLDARGQRVYRRQVRKSLFNGVRLAIPIARRLLSEAELEELLIRWLDESPPTTRLYWQLPMEFAAWVATLQQAPHPALPELIHWETVEVEILHAPDPEPAASLTPTPELDRRPELSPSARLCIFQHPVHQMTREAEGWPAPLEVPAFVLAYRRQERMRWRALSPQVAQLLAKTAEGATVGQGLDFLRQLYGEVDPDPVLSALGGLVERGALLGFAPAE